MCSNKILIQDSLLDVEELYAHVLVWIISALVVLNKLWNLTAQFHFVNMFVRIEYQHDIGLAV